jgi:hypothetical protein
MTGTYFRRNDDKHAFICVFTGNCLFWHYAGWSCLASVLQSVQTPLTIVAANLALLDTRVTTLINAFAAAIP